MGSSSAPISPEDKAAMEAANNATATEMANKDKYYVTSIGGSSGSGGVPGLGTSIPNMSDDGLSFTVGGGAGNAGTYTYNPQTGNYHDHGGNIISLGKAEAQAPTSGGGGGGNKKPTPETTKPTVPGAHGPADSETILGDTYDHMFDWEPISSDGEGGTQEMNPLVDPNAWFHEIDPKYATPTYSNAPPNIQYGPGGLLQMDYDQENKGLLA